MRLDSNVYLRFLPPLILLAMMACHHHDQPKPGPAKAQPDDRTCFAFTYPATAPAPYGKSILHYVHKQGRPSRNKMALLKRHLDCAQQNYDTLIAGSKVRIFKPIPLASAPLLAQQLDLDGPAPATGALLPSNFGPIHYQPSANPYHYQDRIAYVDFANRRLGGGVLGRGFVQEEILMLESNLLPWVATLRASHRLDLSFAPGVSLLDLNREPAVIGLRRFLEVTGTPAIYGRRLDEHPDFHPDRHLRPLAQPNDIYIIAMAARNFRVAPAVPGYSEQDITDMLLLAIRGFTGALLAQWQDQAPLAIHTGNWGAGAYGHNPRTVWALQRVAMAAAYQQFIQLTGQTPPVSFTYAGFDDAGAEIIQEAHQVFVSEFPAQGTVKDYAHLIWRRTQTDPAWQLAP